ncbi:uncharacterized protein [Atheta coriaria]|uniref:uncharacterized protein n=1 Tax=Dalotia coriaria TaxID=877792 RepID=UPI0031F434E1
MVKKKLNYDFSLNYMEEVNFPTLAQKLLLFHTDPVWYRFIISGMVIETLMIVLLAPLNIRIFSHYHLFFARIDRIFNTMYFCDIFLSFYQKFFFKYRYPYPNPIRRPGIVIFLETISVLPYEYLFGYFVEYKTEYNWKEERYYMLLFTLHMLKLPRLFFHVYNNRRELHNDSQTRVLELIVFLLIFCGFFVHILHMLDYLTTLDDIYDAFELITCNVAGRGSVINDVRTRETAVYKFEVTATILAILMWTFAIYPSTCYIILAFIENEQHRFNYSHLIDMFQLKISDKYSLDEEKYKLITDYFKANWKLSGGFFRDQFGFAQKSLRDEIAMDTCWPAFKHSMLFRNAEFYILRALADKFTRRIRMEGEYIFSKNKQNLGLIYIVEGVIDVLSAENNESGILSLTSGTCVGEAALMIPHVSPVNFRCKTVCELYELPWESFMIFQKSYPFEHKQLQLKLYEILHKVRLIKEYNAKFNQVDVERKRMIWIKHQLHNMMSFKSEKNTHEQTNVYLRREIIDCVKDQKHIFHTPEFLDRLAIRERTSSDVDLVFIKNTCPWILKAGSPITNLWENLIVIITIICSVAVCYGFCVEYTYNIVIITLASQVLFAIDLVVQIITPTDSKSDARTMTAVLYERLKTKGFFLDIASVHYWRMIAFALDTHMPWYDLFKLIKLWRVWKYFSTWRERYLVNMIFFTIFAGFTFYFALIYALSCFFKLTEVTDRLWSSVTIQFATGAGLPFQNKNQYYPTYRYAYIFANFLSLIVQLGVTAMVCSSFYLQYMAKAKIVNTIFSLEKWVSFKENYWLWMRLHAYFNVLRQDNDVLLSGGNVSGLFELPIYFEIIMKSNVHFQVLKKLQIFQYLPDEIITNLLMHTSLFTGYRHSIIISRGIIYEDIYVLIKGECRTLINGNYLQTKMYEPLNFIECCYNSPAVTSTVALTECLILKFNYNEFVRLLYESRKYYRHYEATVRLAKEENQEVLTKLLYDPIMIVRSRNKRPCFKFFKYFARKDSYEEFDYHVPFDKIRPFDFIKYFLMRTTFYPEGTFIKYYEVIRCFIAFIAAFTFTLPAINIGAYIKRSSGYTIMLALDVFAILDIYIRMHVAYYTPEGILVTHPLRTARYYMSHGFLVDFLAVFPFHVFPMKVQYRVLLNAIHALQLHRLAALRWYYSTDNRYYVFNTITMVCYVLFTANLITAMIFIYDCYTWDVEHQAPVSNCKTFKYGDFQTHFHILFLVMSSLQCSGMTGKIYVDKVNDTLAIILSLLTIIGVVTQILYKAYIFSSFSSKMIRHLEFVVGVRRLIRLLAYGRADTRYLRKEVTNYYDLYWERVASRNMSELTKNMITALRRDMLFKFYGDNLVVYSVFTENLTDTTLFIKNIFLEATPMIMPKNGYVITINDIEKDIYLLNSGSLDVISADGVKMRELTAGAIFGNFSGAEYTRMKISIVANVNTELVYLSSKNFFKITSYFPKIQERAEHFIKMNIFYIESTKPVEPHLTMTVDEYVRAVTKYSFFRIINYIHLFYVCYLGTCLEFYQIAVGEIRGFYLFIQYSMDMIHILREYLKFCLPYKDEHKAPISDKKKITALRVANKPELYIMILTVIYLDLLIVLPILLFGRYELSSFSKTFSFLRLNRLLRIYYIRAAYAENQKRLSQNSSNLMKWFYVIYWFLLSYQFIATASLVLDSFTTIKKHNLIHNLPPDKVRNVRNLPPAEKFEIYWRYIFFSNLIHINTTDKFYGPSNLTFNIFIIVLYMYRLVVDSLLLCKFFEAIVDIAVLRRIYLKASSFLKFYMDHSYGTLIVKRRVLLNAKFVWTKNYYRSDLLVNDVCARYLKEVIINHMYGYLLRRHPVLSHTHMDFIRQLSSHLQKVFYPINCVVIYRKSARKCMFFIHKGSVSAYDVDFGYRDIALDNLSKGDSFGFLQGLTLENSLYDYTYITSTHCEILELEWDSWCYLLEHFPATKEYIFEAAKTYKAPTSLKVLGKEVKKDYW